MIKWLKDRITARKIRVIDAAAPLSLEVTSVDISGATQKDPSNCAFACAIKRNMGATGACFMRSAAYVEYDDRIVRYRLTDRMAKEIVAFDRAKAMEPGIYELATVAPSKRRTGKKAAEARRRKNRRRRAAASAKNSKSTTRSTTKSTTKRNPKASTRVANIRTGS